MTNRSRIAPGDFGFEGNEPRRGCSDTFDEVLARRLHRRSVLKGGVLAPLFSMGTIANLKGQQDGSGLRFAPIQGSAADEIGVPEGYKWEALAALGAAADQERSGVRPQRSRPGGTTPAGGL